MSFSAFTWKLYRDSDEGRIAIARDIQEHEFHARGQVDGKPFWAKVPSFPVDDGEAVQPRDQEHLYLEDLRPFVHDCCDGESIGSLDEAELLFADIADNGTGLNLHDDNGEFTAILGGGENIAESGYVDIYRFIQGLTAGLHELFPEYFTPYFFAWRFDDFRRICERYDIAVPDLPGKQQKRQRALYYIELNRALQEFRRRADLSPEELNAFLYDFAPRDIDYRRTEALTTPARVWFVMGGIGGNADFEFLDSADNTSISHWQGNLETRRGDIVLMWCVSPRSYLHSVWRTR